MDAPFDLVLTFNDGTTQRLHQTAAVWQEDGKRASIAVSTARTVRSVTIDGGIWVDADASNNGWTGN
jgi:hypothetical protein